MGRKILWVIYLIFGIISVPLLVSLAKTAQVYISKAGGSNANIVIDTKTTLGNFPRTWSALAQGGEEPPPMLKNVVADIKALNPSYIRIDHIYDLYLVVSKADGRLKFDFTKLDETVSHILATGALPFLSLSYMPTDVAVDGNTTSPPNNWTDWETIVRETIEHYSGRNNKNLANVYYEVWNEPDLFGNWSTSGERDYRLLYFHSVVAANQSRDSNTFFIGGPAYTHLNSNFMSEFMKYVSSNNLRLDFLSWHRYTTDPSVFLVEAQKARNILSNYPNYANRPLVISEWGIDSENNPFYDTSVSAAFDITAIKEMLGLVKLAFAFEIKDGPSPEGKAYWGRWGLITHKQGGLVKKPRYHALKMLDNMKGARVSLRGEGSWVRGFATKDGETIIVILANYDKEGLHAENVPVTFNSLPSSYYTLKSTHLNGVTKQNELVVTTGTLSQNFLLNANDIVLIELTSSAQLAAFSNGKSGISSDQALILNSTPLNFTSPTFRLSSAGSISFDLKPNWEGFDDTDRIIFDIPFSPASGPTKHLSLKKSNLGFSNKLVFGIFDEGGSTTTVSYSISNWVKGDWHGITAKWDTQELSLVVDSLPIQAIKTSTNIQNGNILTFFPSNSAIDNLIVSGNGQEMIRRTFDGAVDR
ncbi:hypothetical protein HY407_04975 [Candidatus Gottesmanbacteria bacterium]|nr:hypothetical protein [Candidatus Gottesmanbacteria bacterium]